MQSGRQERRPAQLRWEPIRAEWLEGSVRKEAQMARAKRSVPVVGPFDFTDAMTRLCSDIADRHEAFAVAAMERLEALKAQGQ